MEAVMMIEKQCIGAHNIDNCTISYYLIKKCDTYGVEIVEERNKRILCESEFISQVQETAKSFTRKIYENCVTAITLNEVVDDYFSM